MPPRIPKQGYLGPLELYKTNVYIHWSFPIGGLFLASFIGELNLFSSIILVVSYTSLVIIHELGRALVAIYYKLSLWLKALSSRAHPCKVIVALANKLARIAWAVLASGKPYQVQAI
jgi:hypothetical protein